MILKIQVNVTLRMPPRVVVSDQLTGFDGDGVIPCSPHHRPR
jgi:hypothetical protein